VWVVAAADAAVSTGWHGLCEETRLGATLKLGLMVQLSGEAPWSAFQDQMEIVGRAQVECVQLSVHQGPRLSDDVLWRALDALYQRGVEVSALGLYLNLLRPDDRGFFAGNDLTTFDMVVRALADTGGRPVVVWGGTHASGLGQSHPENHTEASYQQVTRLARPLVERLRDVGGSLLVEPFHAHVLGSAFQLTRFCQELGPGVGVVLDPINLVTAETFPDHRAHVEAVITALADHAAIVHLKDIDLDPETGQVTYPSPGRGALDYVWYARALANAADGAPGIIEHVSGEACIDARAQVERSLG